MTVQFNQVPGNIRVPLFWAEINPAQSPYQSLSRHLIIGQKLSAGTAAAAAPIMWTGNEDGLFGSGSMLAYQCRIARLNAPFQETWVLPLADDGSAVAATGCIDVTAAPTITGELTVYIGGHKVRVPVTPSDVAADVAARLVAAINVGDINGKALPVTALQGTSGNTHKCNLTARNGGTDANFIRLEVDYYSNEGPLAAAMLTLTQMASGATDPALATPLANLADMEFDFISTPYTDSTSLAAYVTLTNGVSGRWSPNLQLYGHIFSAKEDTVANLTTFGAARNDPHLSVMGYYNCPQAPSRWAAALGAIAAQHLQSPPEMARPLQTLPLLGIQGPKAVADRFTVTQRNSLYYKGMAASFVQRDGTVCIDRCVTTYQTNAYGSPDPSWLDVETMFLGPYAVRYLKAKVSGQWGRAALVDDNPQGRQGAATPKAIKNTILHGYQELVNLNVLENFDLFSAALIVERNAVDRNRVDVYLPLDVANQLRIIGVNATTFLQFDGSQIAA